MSGLCGVVSTQSCVQTLFFGTDYHSHMGSARAGLAVYGSGFKKKIHDISQGQFKTRFADSLDELSGQMGIGVISDQDAQPLLIQSRFGTYGLALAGLIQNRDALVQELFKVGSVFTETNCNGVNSVELLAKIIELGSSLEEGIAGVYNLISGSASMLVLTAQGIYAARDRLGRSSLMLAQKPGEYMIASETCALHNLGHRLVHTLGPGEVVFVNSAGWRVVKPPLEPMQICSFFWIYSGDPSSTFEGINTETVRERCGGFLAARDNVEADLVSGAPDSGIGHAIGYAMRSRIPYRRVLVKYTPGYGRSYTPTSQSVREHVARMKLIPVTDVVRNNRIVLCEDSIVRGTQLKSYTVSKLRDAGVKEIHLRSACPPLMFPCVFLSSTRSVDELVTRRAIQDMEGTSSSNLSKYLDESTPEYAKMVEWIRKDLNLTTLQFQKLDDMVEAIGLPRERLCLYCWTGKSSSYECRSLGRQLPLL